MRGPIAMQCRAAHAYRGGGPAEAASLAQQVLGFDPAWGAAGWRRAGSLQVPPHPREGARVHRTTGG